MFTKVAMRENDKKFKMEMFLICGLIWEIAGKFAAQNKNGSMWNPARIMDPIKSRRRANFSLSAPVGEILFSTGAQSEFKFHSGMHERRL